MKALFCLYFKLIALSILVEDLNDNLLLDMDVVYFDQRLGAAHPNAGQNSSKTTEF
jgi:hypothetical protein